MVSFPYYSHTTPIRIPKDMGIVWEAYHKGVPLLGVPENPIEKRDPFWTFGSPQVPSESIQVGIMPDPEIDRVLGLKELTAVSGERGWHENIGTTNCCEFVEWGKQEMILCM